MAFQQPLIGFELLVFEDPKRADPTAIIGVQADGTADAKRRALRVAKDNECNVDIAYEGDAPFNERYIATAQFNDFTDKWEVVRIGDDA